MRRALTLLACSLALACGSSPSTPAATDPARRPRRETSPLPAHLRRRPSSRTSRPRPASSATAARPAVRRGLHRGGRQGRRHHLLLRPRSHHHHARPHGQGVQRHGSAHRHRRRRQGLDLRWLRSAGEPLLERRRPVEHRGLFSGRLRRLLADLGVHNIDCYPVTIENPLDGTRSDDYALANLIGRIACIDLERSTLQLHPRLGNIELIDSLVLDESKLGDLLMFRTAEHAQVIVVHESVRDACVAAGLTGMVFVRPEDLSL